jgi:hypothetical protein
MRTHDFKTTRSEKKKIGSQNTFLLYIKIKIDSASDTVVCTNSFRLAVNRTNFSVCPIRNQHKIKSKTSISILMTVSPRSIECNVTILEFFSFHI